MDVWFAAAGFVDAFDLVGGEDANGDVLRNHCFAWWAVSIAVATRGDSDCSSCCAGAYSFVEPGILVVSLAWSVRERAATQTGVAGIRERGTREDREREEGNIIFLCKTNGGRGGVLCGAEGTVEVC